MSNDNGINDADNGVGHQKEEEGLPRLPPLKAKVDPRTGALEMTPELLERINTHPPLVQMLHGSVNGDQINPSYLREALRQVGIEVVLPRAAPTPPPVEEPEPEDDIPEPRIVEAPPAESAPPTQAGEGGGGAVARRQLTPREAFDFLSQVPLDLLLDFGFARLADEMTTNFPNAELAIVIHGTHGPYVALTIPPDPPASPAEEVEDPIMLSHTRPEVKAEHLGTAIGNVLGTGMEAVQVMLQQIAQARAEQEKEGR